MTEKPTLEFWVNWFMALGATREEAEAEARELYNPGARSDTTVGAAPFDVRPDGKAAS